jgi:hypothetical protein
MKWVSELDPCFLLVFSNVLATLKPTIENVVSPWKEVQKFPYNGSLDDQKKIITVLGLSS